MSRISVIVPVYNVELWLEQCIESIINQTYSDLEIILVDDGSQDKSGCICDEYKKKDNRIRVIHKENGGLSDARNVGIREATGEFITFVDSDDWIDLKIYEYAMKLQQVYNADIVEYGIERISGREVYKEFSTYEREEIYICEGKEMLPRIYQSNLGGSIVAWNKIYKKALFDNNFFEKGRIFEDTLLIPKIFYGARCCVATTKVGYYYYQGNPKSITKTLSAESIFDRLYAHQNNRKFYDMHGLEQARLWCDTNYAFVLIQALKSIRKEIGKDSEDYIRIKKEYSSLLKFFLINPYFIWKQKILLIWYSIIM